MLIELSVRNLAVFEDVRVEFTQGLNVVTGETGSGKSILVEAIRLTLGEKADPMAVRSRRGGGRGLRPLRPFAGAGSCETRGRTPACPGRTRSSCGA
jgi:energy-coupling factor transporter ATP-binding protein EcfA2